MLIVRDELGLIKANVVNPHEMEHDRLTVIDGVRRDLLAEEQA